MRSALIVIGVLVLGALLVGGNLVSSRNELVTKREAIEGSWAQVDVALQRRADLIPNLVNTVKGYAAQEKEIYTNIANARAALTGARTQGDKITANEQLDSALARLLVIVESYPQLKSNENFMRLQDELAGTENRIAVERRKYNEVVQDYNTTRDKFPANIAASLFGFARHDAYFNPDPGPRPPPTMDFPK